MSLAFAEVIEYPLRLIRLRSFSLVLREKVQRFRCYGQTAAFALDVVAVMQGDSAGPVASPNTSLLLHRALELHPRRKLCESLIGEQCRGLAEVLRVIQCCADRMTIEANAIRDVEHLPAKLQLDPISKAELLVEATVPAVVPVPAQRIPRT